MSLTGGKGGKGASTFHSEPRKEFGGPDGGNGGDGGTIIIKGMYLLIFQCACMHEQTVVTLRLSIDLD